MSLQTPLPPQSGPDLAHAAASETPAPASKEGTTRFVQEKIMMMMGLIFFGGILVYTFVPSPFNGAAMGLMTFLTIFVMFRFN